MPMAIAGPTVSAISTAGGIFIFGMIVDKFLVDDSVSAGAAALFGGASDSSKNRFALFGPML